VAFGRLLQQRTQSAGVGGVLFGHRANNGRRRVEVSSAQRVDEPEDGVLCGCEIRPGYRFCLAG
jgi:hypothetical protein